MRELHLRWICFFVITGSGCVAQGASQPKWLPDHFAIPVLVICYFPTNGTNINLAVTGDWGSHWKQRAPRPDGRPGKSLRPFNKAHGTAPRPFPMPCLKYEIRQEIEVSR